MSGARHGFAHGAGAESKFKQLALEKGWKVHRSGWPDFLIVADGKAQFVEVKSATDSVSDNQAELYAALSSAGVEVFIWWESSPQVLIPWRRFEERQRQEKQRAQSRSTTSRVRKAPGFDVRWFNARGQLSKRGWPASLNSRMIVAHPHAIPNPT